jgi:putative SOS response-associated peptidase YedK
MVNRYSLTAEAKVVSERFLVDPTEAYTPAYNAAPTRLLPVITQESRQGISFFYWGAPPAWANEKALAERIINTHAEIIAEKTVLRKKLREHRCLVPADGFYAWKRIGKKTSVPYRFTLPDQSPFAIAGLWEEYDDQHGEPHHTFTVITTGSNEWVSPIAERMPAILDPSQEQDWLSSGDDSKILKMLVTYPGRLDHYSVSSRVNNAAKDDRTVILPAPAADQFGNLTLFD